MNETRKPARDIASGEDEATSERTIREARVTIGRAGLETVGIEELVSVWVDVGLRQFWALACHETGAVVQVVTERPIDTDRLDGLESVDRWKRITDAGETPRYVVEFTAPHFPPSIARRHGDLVDISGIDVAKHGIAVTLVGSQGTIASVIGEYEALGLSPNLRKLGPFEGHERPLETLTERQRDVLETAYELGYYEVPRAVTSRAIAAELDVDASTVTEHLQRAERNLLARHLSADRRVCTCA